MADYLTRLVERTLGLPSTVRPEVPPTFAPETGYPPDPEPAGEPGPDTGPVGHAIRRAGDPSRSVEHVPGQDPPEREERIPLSQQSDGPELGARDHAPLPRTEGPARETETGNAEKRAEIEHHLIEREEGEPPGEVRSTPPEREPEGEEHLTGTSEARPLERPGTNHDEPDAAPSPGSDAELSGGRAVSPTDATGSDRGASPALEMPAAPDLPTSQTSGREEREAESSVPGARRLPSAAPDLAERTPEPRTPIPGAPLASTDDRARATPPAAIPHRRETKEAPMIRVSIGRVEVRAITTEPAQRPPEERPEPALSLDEYLRQQSGGSR